MTSKVLTYSVNYNTVIWTLVLFSWVAGVEDQWSSLPRTRRRKTLSNTETRLHLRGKLSWQSGVQKYPQSDTTQQTSHRRLIGKDTESGCLCSGEEQKRTEQEAGFIECFFGVVWPDIGLSFSSVRQTFCCLHLEGLAVAMRVVLG